MWPGASQGQIANTSKPENRIRLGTHQAGKSGDFSKPACQNSGLGIIAKSGTNGAACGNRNDVFHGTGKRNTNRIIIAVEPQITTFKSILNAVGGCQIIARCNQCSWQSGKHLIGKAWPGKHRQWMVWQQS